MFRSGTEQLDDLVIAGCGETVGARMSRQSGSGEAWDHLGEVNAVLDSLEKAEDNLLRVLHRMQPGSPGYGKLSREIDAISELGRRIQEFLEIQ